MQKKFSKWIEEFIKQNNIDITDVLELEKNGKKHYFTIEQIIEGIKLINENEQYEIREELEELAEQKEEIKDYFSNLAVGFINTLELDEELEETI